jgi:hypothetical protein
MVSGAPHLPEGKLNLKLDVQMGSPTPLHGSSSTTGGVLRGRAYGNIFNVADAEKAVETGTIGPVIGRVKIFNPGEDPSSVKPQMVLKAEVCQTMAPVLTDLGELYSPVKSELVKYCPNTVNLTNMEKKIREYLCMKKATGASRGGIKRLSRSMI